MTEAGQSATPDPFARIEASQDVVCWDVVNNFSYESLLKTAERNAPTLTYIIDAYTGRLNDEEERKYRPKNIVRLLFLICLQSFVLIITWYR